MNTYIAIIGGKAVLTFRAVDDDQAHAMIDDQEGSVRSDLKVLVDTDGKPLWDGKSAIQVREATAAQHAEATGKSTWMLATIQMSGTLLNGLFPNELGSAQKVASDADSVLYRRSPEAENIDQMTLPHPLFQLDCLTVSHLAATPEPNRCLYGYGPPRQVSSVDG
jgi:hypothetical protein